jgi:hypothetical protein
VLYLKVLTILLFTISSLTTQMGIGESNGCVRAARMSKLIAFTHEENFPRLFAAIHFRWLSECSGPGTRSVAGP